ncbi:MAG: antitoxin [Acidobacteria bacterium]|nr:antitoxin [Acidobacteriota bacterium]
MKRLNVELEDTDYRYLKDLADRQGRSVVAVIREAVARLRRSEDVDPRADPMYGVGSFDGPRDLAERHDDYLYGA